MSEDVLPMRTATVRLRLLMAAGLLIGAGICLGRGLFLRWERCLAGFETAGCTAIQSHEYDYHLPSDPWTPVPGAAELDGTAHLLIAAALFVLVRPGRWSPALSVLWPAVPATFALAGSLTLWSGVAASTVPVNLPLQVLLFLGSLPLPVIVALLLASSRGRDAATSAAVALLIVLAFTFEEYFFFIRLYGSHDTPPWTGSVRAGLLVVLGLVLLVFVLRRSVAWRLVVLRRRRIVAGLLVVAAGVSIAIGLSLRWARCLAGSGTVECGTVQDDRFDVVIPTEPWTAVAADLDGLGHLLLAAGLVLAVRIGPGRPIAAAGWWLLVAFQVIIGAGGLLSGLLSAPLSVNTFVEVWWVVVGTPALAVVAVLIAIHPARDGVSLLVALLLAALAVFNPVIEYLVFLGYVPSHDTPPWTGSISAALLVVVGLAIAVAAAVGRGAVPVQVRDFSS